MGKRILFFVGGSRVYGAEIAMLNVMRGLKKKGYLVHCIASGWNDGDFISRLEREQIPYSVLHLGFIYIRKILWTLDTLTHYPSALTKFYKTKNSFKPDYTYHIGYRTILMLYPWMSKKNNVLHVHDIMPRTILNRIYYLFVRNKVTRFIAVSDQIRRSLMALDIPGNRITVIPNGISDFARENVSIETDDKIGLTLGIVGQIIKRKGHVVLIEALHILKERKREFKCLIIGGGDNKYIEEVQSLVERYELGQHVKWLHYVADQKTIYRRIDILVVPSHYESCPLVVLEASLCGIPIIASRVGGLSELISDGVTGCLFTPGNAEELAEKIATLMQDEERRKQMGKSARDHALKSFTAELMCNEIDQLLGSML